MQKEELNLKKLLDRFYARLDGWGEKLNEKQFRIPTDLSTGIIFLLLSIILLVIMPQQVKISEKDIINGRAFPTLVCYVMMVCSAVLVITDVVKLVKKQPIEMKVINMKTEGKALILFGIVYLSYFLAKVTKLFVIGGIFCCIGFLVYFRAKKPSYYAITIAVTVAVWAAFRFALGVDF